MPHCCILARFIHYIESRTPQISTHRWAYTLAQPCDEAHAQQDKAANDRHTAAWIKTKDDTEQKKPEPKQLYLYGILEQWGISTESSSGPACGQESEGNYIRTGPERAAGGDENVLTATMYLNTYNICILLHVTLAHKNNSKCKNNHICTHYSFIWSF